MSVHGHMPQLLAISGSLRSGSFNTAVLQAVMKAARDRAEIVFAPLGEIPLYNADFENEKRPVAVERFKKAIVDCDGLLICSPEFNYGMPGVLKNALDWASRPAFKSPLKDKPALIMTASPASTGGVRAHYQIRETLASALARVVCGAQIAIPAVNQKMIDGAFSDQATLDFTLCQIDQLLSEIRLSKAPANG